MLIVILNIYQIFKYILHDSIESMQILPYITILSLRREWDKYIRVKSTSEIYIEYFLIRIVIPSAVWPKESKQTGRIVNRPYLFFFVYFCVLCALVVKKSIYLIQELLIIVKMCLCGTGEALCVT